MSEPVPIERAQREHKAAAEADLGFELPTAAPLGRGKGTVITVVFVIAVACAFAAGLLPKLIGKRTLAEASSVEEHALPRVEVFTPKSSISDRDLTLPGSVQPLEETVLYPRAAGYVRRWLADIGDHVKEGQLLAEIDTPELDAQIEQARADLAQAEAGQIRASTSADLSKSELDRYETLTPAGISSRQELEQRRAQAKVDQANIKVAGATVASQQANLHRLTQLKSFARVVAPFGGTIVSRTIERGALVSVGNGTPLYKLAALDPVRVLVQAPQDVAPGVHAGQPAHVTVREYAGRTFAGVIARAAGALDDASRTMTTEVRIPNPKSELMPGMYVEVSLSLPTPHRLYEVPATALFNDAQGTRVATVDASGKIAMRKIGIERDAGNVLLVSTGLDGSERIVKLASSVLTNDVKVEVIAPPPAAH